MARETSQFLAPLLRMSDHELEGRPFLVSSFDSLKFVGPTPGDLIPLDMI